MLKYIITAIIVSILFIGVLLASGCGNRVYGEIDVLEKCYDGVVYISQNSGSPNLSIKLDTNGEVLTETFDGTSCK